MVFCDYGCTLEGGARFPSAQTGEDEDIGIGSGSFDAGSNDSLTQFLLTVGGDDDTPPKECNMQIKNIVHN